MILRHTKYFRTPKLVALAVTMALCFILNPASVKAQGFASITNIKALDASKNTGEKPQSKVWTYDGKWWSVFPISSGAYVWRLDGTSWTSVLKISSSNAVKADCKLVDNVCHILLWRKEGSPSQLVSVEYVPASKTYKLWSRRTTAVSINLDDGVETGTIDIDGNGRMWLASDGNTDIRVRWSDIPYSTWSSPIIIATGTSDDDICGIISLPLQGQIGVLWSNQKTKRFGFKTHLDSANPSTWSTDEVPASQSALNIGYGMSDDHLNMAKASDGTLYCAVKTSYDKSGYPRISLLKRNPGGSWDNLYKVSETGTRPIVILNETAGKLKILYTSEEDGGDILYRESSISTISFGAQRTLISGTYDNPTSTKNNYDSDIVILAADHEQIVGVLANDITPSTAPDVPTLLSPADLATQVAVDPTLSWNASLNAASYRVQVSAFSDFSTPILDQNNITATSVKLNNLSGSSQYYWRAYATNSVGSSVWSATWSFTTVSQLPSIPILSSPLNIASDVSVNPTLIWTASSNATSYRVQVSAVTDFSTIIFDQSNISSTTVQVNDLINSTLYYWRVQSTNSFGSSAWSSIWNFTTISQLPSTPTLSSPANLAVDVDPNPKLSWNASAGADLYEIQVSTSTDFSEMVFDQSDINTTSVQVNDLTNSTLYYWRVQSVNSFGESAWSSVWSFTTISQFPSIPTLSTPSNLATGVATNPALNWNSSLTATTYQVQVSVLSDFSTVVLDQGDMTTTSVQLNGLANNTVYFWRVLATNSFGNSAWSTVWSFTTIASMPTSSLVGFWKMDEGAGTILIDDSGFGNNGTIYGSPSWVVSNFGQALKLNGTNQYALVPDAASLDITQAITLAAWIKPEKLASQHIIHKGLTVDGYMLTLLSTGKISFQVNQISSDAYKLNSRTLYPYDGNTWMHIAATFNGSVIRIYINGVEDKSISFTSPVTIKTNQIPMAIGAKSDGASSLKGAIDEVRVYNYVLSAAEISGLIATSNQTNSGRIGSGEKISELNSEIAVDSSSNSLNEILVYPNPVSNKLTLTFPQAKDQSVWISISDPQGKIYFSVNTKVENGTTEINLGDLNLTAGLHLLIIRSSNYYKVIKFIKT